MILPKFNASRTRLAIICIIIFVIALVPRLLTYNFALPYVEHVDEPAHYLKVQEWRGLTDLHGYNDGYPPAFLVMDWVIQVGLQANGPLYMASTVQVLRMFAAFANASVAVFLFLSAYYLASPLGNLNALAAGVIAGGLWALLPLPVSYIYATPDPFVYFFAAASLCAAIYSVIARRVGIWAVISICLALTATFFKYSALPLVALGFLALGYRWLGSTYEQRSGIIRAGFVGFLLVVASAFFILFIYRADLLNTPGTSDVARAGGFSNLFNIEYFTGNLRVTFDILGVTGALLVLVSPILLFAIQRYTKAARSIIRITDTVCQLVLCYWLIITVPLLINTFSPGTTSGVRFLIPATIAACALIGVTITALCSLPVPKKYAWLSASAACLISLLLTIPSIQQTSRLVIDRRLPDSRVALRQWADMNLSPGSVLVTSDTHKTFNPFWGGIPYRNWFDWVEQTDLTIRTPEEWHQETGVDYIAYPADQWETVSSELDTDEVLILGEFGGQGWRGPHTILARVQPLQHHNEVNFANEIALNGFEFSQTPSKTGETFSLQLFWQALTQPQANYSTFLHLTAANEVIPIAQADGAPGGSDQQTALWQPEQRFFSDTFDLSLPPDLPPGNYVVRLGLYDYLTGVRLPATTAEAVSDSAVLFSFTINDQGEVTNLHPD